MKVKLLHYKYHVPRRSQSLNIIPNQLTILGNLNDATWSPLDRNLLNGHNYKLKI